MTDAEVRVQKLEALVREFIRATSYRDQDNEQLADARSAAVRLMPSLRGMPNDLAPVDRFPNDGATLA